MAGVSFRIDVTDDTVGPALARLVRAGQDLSPAMDEIGVMLVASTVRRFETGKSPQGAPWQPSRRALAEGGKTLVDSGRLRDSITHAFGRDFVEVGSNVVYARIHQLGGDIKQKARTQVLAFGTRGGFASRRSTRRRKAGAVRVAFAAIGARTIDMPARPYLGVSDDDKDEIVNILRDHFGGPSAPRTAA